MTLALEFDVRNGPEVAMLLDKLKGKANRAVVGALKDVGKKARTEIARGVTKQIKVAYGSTLKRVRIHGPTPSNLAMRISLDEKSRPGLMAFGARQTKRGVSYRIAKSGGRKFVPGAFIVRSNGAERVFRRVGPKSKPVVDLKGPSLNAVVKRHDVDTIATKTIESTLPDRILARLRLADQRSR